MPAERLHAVQAHIGGLIHHGGDQLVGLVVLEEDEQDGRHMADVAIMEHLALLLAKKEHKLLEHNAALLIQEGRDHCLANRRGLCSKERDWLVKIDLVLESVVVWLEIMEILVEDDADDDLVVLDRHSSA